MSEHASEEPMDPQRSSCVLIGVSSYDHDRLEDLPAVRRNLNSMRELLTDPTVWGVSRKRVHMVSNPDSHQEMTGPLRKAAREATDTLLVYYAGHGLLDPRENDLFLTTSSSQRRERWTALGYQALREIVEDECSAQRRIIVLDCCYSGKATKDTMAADGTTIPSEEIIAIEGSYVLTSTSDTLKAEAKGPSSYTAFTGHLIDLLKNGDRSRPDQTYITLNEIHASLRRTLADKKLPQPQRMDKGGVGDLRFVRNKFVPQAHLPARKSGGRNRRCAAAAAMLVLGAAAGAGGMFLWGPTAGSSAKSPQAIPGACDNSGRATLLDVSDRLDREPYNEYLGNNVDGLSALALTSGNSSTLRALALRDEEPSQLFTLKLGKPERLKPQVEAVQGLYRDDGKKFSEFDGEGMVVEKGGKTILATSELGPAIRRFEVSNGKQVGADLPIPKAFRPPEEGEAPRTRTLESLAVTPSGEHLFAGMEGPLLGDDDVHGRHQVRIQRYTGEPGKAYEREHQYAYQTEEGLYLAELLALDKNHLLALERGYIRGLGNGIHIYKVDLSKDRDITDEKTLGKDAGGLVAPKELLLNLGQCPPGAINSEEIQPNPILQNVEGMTLGPELSGKYKGQQALYMVADNNSRTVQSTRLYSLAVRLN